MSHRKSAAGAWHISPMNRSSSHATLKMYSQLCSESLEHLLFLLYGQRNEDRNASVVLATLFTTDDEQYVSSATIMLAG